MWCRVRMSKNRQPVLKEKLLLRALCKEPSQHFYQYSGIPTCQIPINCSTFPITRTVKKVVSLPSVQHCLFLISQTTWFFYPIFVWRFKKNQDFTVLLIKNYFSLCCIDLPRSQSDFFYLYKFNYWQHLLVIIHHPFLSQKAQSLRSAQGIRMSYQLVIKKLKNAISHYF